MIMDTDTESHGAFSPYSPARGSVRVAVRRPLVARLSKELLETYKVCNREFNYSQDLNPKRYLTTPSLGVLNDGSDNANSDLILTVNYVLVNFETQRRYIVKDVVGHGTFGQVAKCWIPDSNAFVALKIIKNQPAYYQQALVEVSILTTLNKKYDPEDKHHVVRIYDYFVFQRHLCICFELLDTNLYELIKMNQFRGLSLNIVQLFSKQILCGLGLLKDAAIIHCDLKPENILLCTSVKPAQVKIIDFGSACMEDRTVYSYIQSRYYRSPEVLLGYQYTTAIDMWSFGCIVAELFLGLPLFPGASEFDLLKRMIQILGGQPPDYLLKEAKNTTKFFKCIGSIHNIESGQVSTSSRSAYQAMTEDEFEAREMKKPSIGKQYFKHKYLEEIVTNYPYKTNLEENDMIKESQIRLALVDFLRGLVEFDPAKRWSPSQASKHPFVTGEPFTCPYKPLLETPRLAVGAQNMRVEHHPGGGHWFAAGLSPNIAGRNRVAQNSYPQQVGQYGGSYGSSIGSYNEIGDANSMFAYYSPAMPPKFLGSSPRRLVPYPTHGGVGMSPSTGSFAVGTSPSARASYHGSPLGKMAAQNYNRKKSLGYDSMNDGFAQHHMIGSAPSTSSSGSARWNLNETPADWDPNYSDELLLQDDASELVSDFGRGLNIASPEVGHGRFNHVASTSTSLPFQRGGHEAYSRTMPPPQSRLGQHGRPRGMGPGPRPNHPTIPPRGRKEYGRIS